MLKVPLRFSQCTGRVRFLLLSHCLKVSFKFCSHCLDDWCHGPLGRLDGTGIPPSLSPCRTPLWKDGAVCCGPQVSWSYSHHSLHAGLQRSLCCAGAGCTEEGSNAMQEAFHCRDLQWPYGSPSSFSGTVWPLITALTLNCLVIMSYSRGQVFCIFSW